MDRLIKKNAERANALGSYHGRRLYRLDYVGFPAHFHAEMLVDMKYTAPSSKEFTVVSQSGEKWLIDHILKRLIDTEREAVQGDNWKRTALDNQNYNFTASPDDGADKSCPYVLAVEPKEPTKFLFRGRVWVNAKDFAVCRIEAEPAKNPSFWIKHTDIHHAYLKTGRLLAAQGKYQRVQHSPGWPRHPSLEYQNYEILAAKPLPESEREKGLPAAEDGQ